VAYALVAPRLQPLLPLTLGLQQLTFLSAQQMLLLVAGGAVLGGMGGMLASRRARS
jgi:hypothetical protein